MPSSDSKISSLTGIRFFAALAVVLYHYWRGFLPGVSFNPLVRNGFMGVSFFFVLSGYILAHVYLNDESRSLEKPKFWVARFARVYPVYVLGFLLDLPYVLSYALTTSPVVKHLAETFGTLSANLLMLQSWWEPLRWRWNRPSWSLCAEAFFYLLFPWLATWIVRQGKTLRRLFFIAGVCFALMLLPPLYAVSRGVGLYENPRPALFSMVVFLPLLRIPEFVLGMATCRVTKLLQQRYSSDQLRQSASIALPIGVAGFLLLLIFDSHIPYILRYNGVADLFFAVIIFGLALSTGFTVRALSLPAVVYLGEISYSVYILQMPLYKFFADAIAKFGVAPHPGAPIANTALFLTYILFLTGCSALCFTYMEHPMRALITGYYKRRQQKAAPETRAAVSSFSAAQ